MGNAVEVKRVDQVEIFKYPAADSDRVQPAWNGYDDPGGEPLLTAENADAGPSHPDWEMRLAEEVHKAFDTGRERGRDEMRENGRESLATARKQEQLRLAELVESFAEAREQYLSAVEGEVVKLALAVAARILRREAQMDPLLLTGAVRVALGQLSSKSEVRLRVPAADLTLWREAIAHIPNLAVKPEVLAGEGLRLGECLVESKVGTVDLGVRSQLGEIERGFFDRGADGTRGNSAEDLPAIEEALP